jgi:hypothetical protein
MLGDHGGADEVGVLDLQNGRIEVFWDLHALDPPAREPVGLG